MLNFKVVECLRRWLAFGSEVIGSCQLIIVNALTLARLRLGRQSCETSVRRKRLGSTPEATAHIQLLLGDFPNLSFTGTHQNVLFNMVGYNRFPVG